MSPLAKLPFVLFALGLLIFGSTATFANDDDLEALNQQIAGLLQTRKVSRGDSSGGKGR